MALPALISGADCGPLNPLQTLSKQFDRDRGIQQDHFGPGRAGPSREVFRTQSTPAPGLDQEASRFFSGQASGAAFASQHVVPNSFDLSSLRGNLPQHQTPVHAPPSPWAGDFLNHAIVQSTSHQSHSESRINSYQSLDADHVRSPYMPYASPMNNTFMNAAYRLPMQHDHVLHDVVSPEMLRPRPVELSIREADFPPDEMQQQEQYSESVDADELSRTAGLLIETVKEETNPKFQNSAFLGLMRQLRDKEMVVEGTDMVKARTSSTAHPPSSEWAQDFTDVSGDKGKGKARAENGWADAFQETVARPLALLEASQTAQERREIRRSYRELVTAASHEHFNQPRSRSNPEISVHRKSVHFGLPEVFEDGATSAEETAEDAEDADERFWKQENEDYQHYWNTAHDLQNSRATPEWEHLQDDWDRFEATAIGIKPVSVYQFQPNNPYLMGDSSTHNHAIHTQRVLSNESILEMEAAVQRDVRNPVTWFELGVKQQENERELSAIQALQRAVDLDPFYLEAWLALAISYTNESDKTGAYDAIEHWVRYGERYDGRQLIALLDKGEGRTAVERHEELIQCLMGLARAAPDGEVDADIQTALGVLLNTSEDYEKAQDCFRAALAVRPNDWLLYNRVGATLANSGRANDALWYYYRALELNPSYIRARFNLGISCINMKHYEEAAGHILDALVLQENDASNGADMRGITSSALWDCLRTTCMQLQRPELAILCDSHDLEGFRKAFWT